MCKNGQRTGKGKNIQGNFDVGVDTVSGEVLPEIGKGSGRFGDSIGNIFDFLSN
jgi:hypothetical protein